MASLIGIVGRMARLPGRGRWYYAEVKAKRVREVFSTTLILPRSDAREGVSAGVSGMTVSGVVNIASGGSGASERDNLLLNYRLYGSHWLFLATNRLLIPAPESMSSIN